ncbi:hypothetical protein GMSM_37890 [Geomonas sp. Red276]
MILRATLIVSVLLFLFGCASRVPVATNFPLTTQKKVKAAHHWDVLADDIAQQTQLAVRDHKVELGKEPLYVKPMEGKAPFNTAFSNLLITRLVNRGLPVSSVPKEGLAISYDTQLLRHDSSRYTHIPGTLTALAAGIWVIRDTVGAASSALPVTLGLTGLADYALGHYAGGATHTELIVTTSIVSDNRYVFRRSDIYYIEDEDTSLFIDHQQKVPQVKVKEFKVVGQ